MRHEYNLFCKAPWNHAGVMQNHNICFEVHDERVAQLFIEGFGLSTIDVEVNKATVVTDEETKANESIYSNGVKPKQSLFRNGKDFNNHYGATFFNGNCQFCRTQPAVGRVKAPEDIRARFCCSDCGNEAMNQGYDVMTEWRGDC